MRPIYLLIPVLAAGSLCAAEKPQFSDGPVKEPFIETKSQTVDFPAGGRLRVLHSIGTLTIEAWDNPNVEITTIKTTKKEYIESERAQGSKALDKVAISTVRKGDELVVSTSFARHRIFPPPWIFAPGEGFSLEYHISVPRNASISIDHDEGDVNVDGVIGDIDAKALRGQIILHLPEDMQYSIDAKCDFGNVNSDFPGEKQRLWIGQRAFHQAPKPAPSLKLRIGYGDIILLRIRVPKAPEATTTSKSSGL